MRRATLVLAAALALCPPPAGARTASPRNPIVAISYYSSSTLKTIRNALVDAHLPKDTPIHYGNYWGTAPTRHGHHHHKPPPPPVDVPHGRVAPLFGWTPNKFWTARRLTSSEDAQLQGDHAKLRGQAPSLGTLLARGGSSAYTWGREIGRRFRDRARQVREHGDEFDSWQFDEVPTNTLHSDGDHGLALVRGMLDGVTYGRPELGDHKLRGTVYFANATLELASRPYHGELKRFWRAVDRDSFAVAGEEYPRFEGNPRRSAFVQSGGQRAMARGPGVLPHLAGKYVVAITPGYLGDPGLGGNTKGRTSDGVAAWRADYLHARAEYGVAGFAAYDFGGTNWYRKSVRPLFRAFAESLRMLGAR